MAGEIIQEEKLLHLFKIIHNPETGIRPVYFKHRKIMSASQNPEFILFKTEDQKISVDVRFENETVWLTQDQMSVLFDKAKSTISEHIKHIFEEGELDEKVVVRNFRITTQHGAIEGKTQKSTIKLYKLDVVISVGYRVKYLRGTQFRQWATKRLNEYIRKGFTMDDERLKNLGGGWLLERIVATHTRHPCFRKSILPPGFGHLCYQYGLQLSSGCFH